MSDRVTVMFEGQPVAARRGESLAAALTGSGFLTLRTTRLDHERGMFCGMGVCQDCLVEVDGRPNQRACMVKVEGPLTVCREAHLRPLPATKPSQPPAEIGAMAVERPEVLVVGAGPGGLSAAIAARRSGAQVVVIDERSQPGGQYYKQLAVAAGDGTAPPDAQHRAGRDLIATARALGVEIRTDALVWGAFEPREFVASDRTGTVRFEPAVAIVATGAYERPWPVPGWTLPGVMTTGAAQTLWRTARRLPGRRVLIAGNGPLNLQLASELLDGGAKVLGVIEAAPRPGVRHFGDLAEMTAAAPGLMRDGLGYHLRCRAGGTALVHGAVIASIEAIAGGLEVRLSDGAPLEQRFVVDAVCLGYGFEPSNELLRALGCGHDFDPGRRHLVTRRDPDGRTDMPGVFAIGDCTGLGGAKAALAEGSLAGLAAARDLGRPVRAAEVEALRRELDRHRRFQRALWRVFAAPGYDSRLATPDTLICRCEEVTFGQIEEALAEQMTGIGAVKRRTRVGMGRCQGRYCAPVLDALLAARFGRQRDELSGFAPRVPVKPVAIEDLARLER